MTKKGLIRCLPGRYAQDLNPNLAPAWVGIDTSGWKPIASLLAGYDTSPAVFMQVA